ncbi:MAG: hypothetical protein ACYS8Z_25840 [Planctomycetota bacterium]|jgi:hypothetical protein
MAKKYWLDGDVNVNTDSFDGSIPLTILDATAGAPVMVALRNQPGSPANNDGCIIRFYTYNDVPEAINIVEIEGEITDITDTSEDSQLIIRTQVGGSGSECVRFGNDQIQAQDGTVAVPSFTFTNDTNTGIYRVGTDSFGFGANGSEAFRVDYGTSNAQLLVNSTASASEPVIADQSDLDTGIDLASNAVSLIQGGTSKVTIDGSNITLNEELKPNDNIRMQELGATPSTPSALETECNIYMKSNKFIVAFNDSSTVRYYYLDLKAAASSSWTHTTTPP